MLGCAIASPNLQFYLLGESPYYVGLRCRFTQPTILSLGGVTVLCWVALSLHPTYNFISWGSHRIMLGCAVASPNLQFYLLGESPYMESTFTVILVVSN